MNTSIPLNIIKAMNHVAVSVPDLDKAIRWYHEILGFNAITEQIDGTSDNSHLGRILTDIFGAEFRKLKLVHMISKNQVGFEVFQFIDPKAERPASGCEECEKEGTDWVALRMCLICGHVGCCDSSVGLHATKHFQNTGHTVMVALPNKQWKWCYVHKQYS